MTEVEKAKKALEEAESKEKLLSRQKELTELKQNYEGKCFGSSTFQRKSKASMMIAVHYVSIYTKDGEIYVDEERVTASKYADYHTTKLITSFYRSTATRQLTGNNEHHASYNLDTSYNKKEIPLVKFKTIWDSAKDIVTEFEEDFYKTVPEIYEPIITIGDHDNMSKKIRCLEEVGIEYIDLEKFPEVGRYLFYSTLPFLDDGRILPKIIARPIIEWHIDALEKEFADNWTTERAAIAITKELTVLKDFVKKYL